MKVLAILPRFPYPIDKGDKLRAYHQLKELSRKHQVFLFALSEERVTADQKAHLAEFCSTVQVFYLGRLKILFRLFRYLFSALPLQTAYYFDRQAAGAFKAFADEVKPDVVFFQLVRTAEYVGCIQSASVLDFQDAMSENMRLRAGKEPFWRRFIFRWEARRLARYEVACVKRFKAFTIISERDRTLLPREASEVCYISGNGIDVNYYQGEKDSFYPADIVFVGAMSYLPNVEAAVFLVNEVLPELEAKGIKPHVHIVGADPSARVLSLSSDLVHVTGRVSDTRPYYRGAKMLVAPMFISTGVQNKILEAMAMGVPVITTPQAAAALGRQEGVPVLTASDPSEFAGHIMHILNHPAAAEELASRAVEFVHQNFSWEAAAESLEKVLARAASADY